LSSPTISLNVVSRNEYADTVRLIAQLDDVDEIVILDMESGDRLAELHRPPFVRVIPVELVPVAETIRHVGFDASTCDWVLVADPDESFPSDFISKLKVTLASTNASMLAIEFNTNAFGREVDFGNYRPAVNRIYRRSLLSVSTDLRGRIHAMPKLVGERVIFTSAGPAVNGQGNMTMEVLYQKLTRYAGSDPSHLYDSEDRIKLSMIPRIFLKTMVRTRLHTHSADALPLYWIEFLHDLALYSRAVEHNGGFQKPTFSLWSRVFLRSTFMIDGLAQSLWAKAKVTSAGRRRR
jgi:hypothetical protein